MESLSPGLVDFTHAKLLLLQLLLPHPFRQRELVAWNVNVYHWKPVKHKGVVGVL